MKREVLLLNESEEILKIISWKRAVSLLEAGKAKKPFGYDKTYNIRTIDGVYELPAAIVLVRYVRVPWDNNKTKPTRRNVFKRDDWTCQYCGKKCKDPKKLTIDHVHPRCKGGDSSWTNLVTACFACNNKKSNSLLKEIEMKLKRKPKKPKFYGLQMLGIDEHGKQLWERWIDIHMR